MLRGMGGTVRRRVSSSACGVRAVRALVSAYDTVVRAWLVVTVWVGVLRGTRLDRLARIRHPLRFVRAALVPADRQVALAIALLPRRRRTEAAIALLSCKAIAAYDDDDRIAAAVAYLTGEASCAPGLMAAGTGYRPHQFDALLASRLPLLRAAIKRLPGDAGRRCCAILEHIGNGLLRARRDRRCGVDHVYGEAVVCAARLVAPTVRPPVFACKAAGRALQLASAIAAASSDDAREMLLYQALRELPTVPRLLQWLPASVDAGARAAATLLAVATYRFYLQQIAAAVPRRLRHPLWTALAAAGSRRSYLATVDAIEDGFRDALAALAVRLDGPSQHRAGTADRARTTSERAARELDRVGGVALPALTSDPSPGRRPTARS
jgi:hypothetical protein